MSTSMYAIRSFTALNLRMRRACRLWTKNATPRVGQSCPEAANMCAPGSMTQYSRFSVRHVSLSATTSHRMSESSCTRRSIAVSLVRLRAFLCMTVKFLSSLLRRGVVVVVCREAALGVCAVVVAVGCCVASVGCCWRERVGCKSHGTSPSEWLYRPRPPPMLN